MDGFFVIDFSGTILAGGYKYVCTIVIDTRQILRWVGLFGIMGGFRVVETSGSSNSIAFEKS